MCIFAYNIKPSQAANKEPSKLKNAAYIDMMAKKDGLIITATATGLFFCAKEVKANVQPQKVSLDVMDIMKLAGGIYKVY